MQDYKTFAQEVAEHKAYYKNNPNEISFDIYRLKSAYGIARQLFAGSAQYVALKELGHI